MPAPLLTVKNLRINTDATPLVHGSSFTVNAGETLALVGESGSGKTLTALAVMGLLPPELSTKAETLSFAGQNLAALSPAARRHLRGKDMAMIFQEPATALNPVLTCGYQVAETFMIHTPGVGRKQRHAKVMELFKQVRLPNPERIFKSYPHQISGGQRQRVMIAMALAHKPKLLIADEPTTALDVTVQQEILTLVKGLQKDLGMAMLWVTHDFGVVKQLADRVAVMQDGRIIETGTAAQVLSKPKEAYTKALLGATLALATPKTAPKLPAKPAEPFPNKFLVAEKLSLTYAKPGWPWQKRQGLKALDNVSLTLAPGQTLGVVGESGSGKSTLANALTRLLDVDAGSITFLGHNFLKLKGEALRTTRKDLQMVFQDPVTSLNPKLPVGETVADGLRAHNLARPKEIRGKVEELLVQCGLPKSAYDKFPHQFSGGQKQRIAIARALALNPKVIVADEAVSALDVSIQAQILSLFQNLQKSRGLSLIFISHDLRVISHLAHHVLVMHDGKVVESGPTAQVFAAPKHAYTQKLLKAVL